VGQGAGTNPPQRADGCPEGSTPKRQPESLLERSIRESPAPWSETGPTATTTPNLGDVERSLHTYPLRTSGPIVSSSREALGALGASVPTVTTGLGVCACDAPCGSKES
jgi:hypothetical protein